VTRWIWGGLAIFGNKSSRGGGGGGGTVSSTRYGDP